MEKVGTSFFSTLNDNLHPSIQGWEEECGVCYPKNVISECLECRNRGLWRSRIGTEHYGLPRTFDETLIGNDDCSIYVPVNVENYVCIIPCYDCAKNNGFIWGVKYEDGGEECESIPCNGVSLENGTNNEYSLHALAIHMIEEKEDNENRMSLTRAYHGQTTETDYMINIIDGVLHDISLIHRYDLENHIRNIKNLWLDEHVFRNNIVNDFQRFMSYFRNLDDLWVISEIFTDRENAIHNVVRERNDQVNVHELCRDGIDILDSVMAYDNSDSILNEENYRNLMDIFQKIFNS